MTFLKFLVAFSVYLDLQGVVLANHKTVLCQHRSPGPLEITSLVSTARQPPGSRIEKSTALPALAG